MLLSLLNLFTAAAADLCAPQTAWHKGGTQKVTSSKAEGAGHNLVTLGFIRQSNLKSVNDKGGNFTLPTVSGAPAGREEQKDNLEQGEAQPRRSVFLKD